MFDRFVVSSVKEMLERHWDVYEIASKLHIDFYTVQAIIDFINNVST
jgi:hypothetical protein